MNLACSDCKMVWRTMTDTPLIWRGSEWWPDKYVCPRCEGRHCRVCPSESIPSDYSIHDLEPEELYAALHGMGLPSEMLCDGATVRELLANHKIEQVVGFDVPNTTRFIIHVLVLDNGTRIHLGASPSGAVVYRISRRHSYVKEVLNG